MTYKHLTQEEIIDIHERIPSDEQLGKLSDFFKVFGDKTRVRILFVLGEGELCVHDIAEALDMSQSAISHQLRVLREATLVKFRREGKEVIYSLNDDHIQTIFAKGLEHINE